MRSATSLNITPRCRICYDSTDDSERGRLIRPCSCSGTVALVHAGCLNRWLENKADTSCELCHCSFEVISCGLKEFSEMTWPHPLGEDLESHFEFCFLALWLFDFGSLLWKVTLYGSQAFSIHLGEKFGTGWLLYFGTLCTIINMFYYGAVFILVIDQWFWENSIFVLRDRNSKKEREDILEKIHAINQPKKTDERNCFFTARESDSPMKIK